MIVFNLLIYELNHSLDLLHFRRSEILHRLKHIYQIDHVSGVGGDCPLFHPDHCPHALLVEIGKVFNTGWPLRSGQFVFQNPAKVHYFQVILPNRLP